MGSDLLFYLFAAVAVVASALVVGQRKPIYSVVLLIVSFIALAGLYVLLDAPFVAVIQIIIYTGAILVLFLFVVMLLNAPSDGTPGLAARVTGPRRLGIVLAALLAAELAWALWAASRSAGAEAALKDAPVNLSSVRSIGQVLYTDYMLAFEVTSLLILVAMLGAVVLAKRHV